MQPRRVDSNHRQISVWIVPYQLGVRLATIREAHFDALSPMHHMAIGQREAVRSEEKTRPAALPSAVLPVNLNVYYRRSDVVRRTNNRFRIGVQKGAVD